MRKRKPEKRLLLSKETLRALAGGEQIQAAGFTGPDCDSIEPWWSCTCQGDGTTGG